MDKGEQLAKVLDHYGLLVNSSYSSFKIVCPFHEDVNPSMTIDLEQGSYFCFGCRVCGDAYTFVKHKSKLSDLKALKLFNKIVSGKVTPQTDVKKRVKKDRIADAEAHAEAEHYYTGLKTIDWSKDEIKGVEDFVDVKKYLIDRGLNVKSLNYSKAKLTYQNPYPVVFPMLDNGEFKGWVCRTNDKEVAKRRKYLYNTGFSRATTLVGQYGNSEPVCIVEGYMDLLKLYQYGIVNAVAILGWKITAEQVKKLKAKSISQVISVLDSDGYGQKGTAELKRHFKVIEWKYQKGIKDPGDMSEEQFDKMWYETLSQAEGV